MNTKEWLERQKKKLEGNENENEQVFRGEKVAVKSKSRQKTKMAFNPGDKESIISQYENDQERSTRKTKKRRGRRSKQEIEDEIREQILQEEMFSGLDDVFVELYRVVLAILLKSTSGIDVIILPERLQALKKSLDVVVKTYLVPRFGKHTPLIALGMISGTIITDSFLIAKEGKENGEEESDNSNSGQEGIGKEFFDQTKTNS